MQPDLTGPDLKEKPLGELLKQLSEETATLVRQELDLAKAEIQSTGKKAGLGAGLVGGAAVVGYLALAALTATLILILNEFMPAWLAAFLVSLAYGGGAFFLAKTGAQKVKEATPPAPQTVETVKEDIEWAKHPTRSAGR